MTNTLDAIESGRAGRTDNLDRYSHALGTTTADVLRATLARIDQNRDVLTDGERQLVELYRGLADADVRAAFVRVTQALALLPAPPRPARTPPRRG